jgi:hypothetical protein
MMKRMLKNHLLSSVVILSSVLWGAQRLLTMYEIILKALN